MMKPRLTKAALADRQTPKCPHCGDDDMAAAEVRLDDLVDAMPLPGRIEVGFDGYAHGHQELVVSCPSCGAPSAFAIDHAFVKLVAMRTEKDERYLSERGGAAP